MTADTRERMLRAAVWTVRTALGAVFIFSGFSKAVDLWGFVYKINEYLAAWHIGFLNRAVVLMAAFAVSAFEFTCGVMLCLGVMRRLVPRLLLLMMAFLLPLTAYIAIADPVADCGCFGDAWVIGNTATFVKNLVITAAIIFLIRYNTRVAHPFLPVMQWGVVAVSLLYCAAVAVTGYRVQPLVDFRPYPVDSPLLDWDDPRKTLTFFSGDEDVTDSVLASSDSLLILAVSDPERHGMARSSQTNALAREARREGTAMIAVVAADDSSASAWARDVAAEYPVFTAEDTQIKELARGDAALVYVTLDTVRWKTNLYSLSSSEPRPDKPLWAYRPVEKSRLLVTLTLIYAALLALVWSLRFTTRKKF